MIEYYDVFVIVESVGIVCDRFGFWCKDCNFKVFFQFGNIVLMVGMVVCDQDVFQFQVIGIQLGQYWFGVVRIDDKSVVVLGQQLDVIVFEGGNERDVEYVGIIELLRLDVNFWF